MAHPLPQKKLRNFSSVNTSPPPPSNGFTEQQIKTLKTALSTSQDARTSLNDLLLDLQSIISKKQMQEQYFDKSHNARPWSQLDPGQEVLFLSPAYQNSYIPSTIVDKASMPHSYTTEALGKQYCRNGEHICPIKQDIVPRNTMHHPEP